MTRLLSSLAVAILFWSWTRREDRLARELAELRREVTALRQELAELAELEDEEPREAPRTLPGLRAVG